MMLFMSHSLQTNWLYLLLGKPQLHEVKMFIWTPRLPMCKVLVIGLAFFQQGSLDSSLPRNPGLLRDRLKKIEFRLAISFIIPATARMVTE
jgi:hypothetical protein